MTKKLRSPAATGNQARLSDLETIGRALHAARARGVDTDLAFEAFFRLLSDPDRAEPKITPKPMSRPRRVERLLGTVETLSKLESGVPSGGTRDARNVTKNWDYDVGGLPRVSDEKKEVRLKIVRQALDAAARFGVVPSSAATSSIAKTIASRMKSGWTPRALVSWILQDGGGLEAKEAAHLVAGAADAKGAVGRAAARLTERSRVRAEIDASKPNLRTKVVPSK